MKSIKETSPETRLLYARIAKMEIGEVIPYAELDNIASRAVQGKGKHNLDRARHIAQRDDNIVTDCVFGVGLKRLDDSGIAGIGTHTLKSIRRKAKKGAKAMLNIRNYNALSNDEKRDYSTTLSVLGVVSHVSEPRRIAAMKNQISDSSNGLPTAETLKLLG